jgi:glycosyltransferase involved in cell wall biosynthesis
MIKVLFDHQKFSMQKYGGISRYFANVIQEMKSTPEFEYELGVLHSKNHYIKSERQLLNNAIGNTLTESRFGLDTYKLNGLYCKYLLRKGNFDVFHPTYYDPYFLGMTSKPTVITIHDMTYERFPEYFWAHDSLTYEKRLNVERADQIIAISQTTKNDLLKYLDTDPDKIKVIYHGIDLDTPLAVSPVPGLPEQYLLFVGDRGVYKNFYLFIRAFKQLTAKYPDLQVVLTGGGKIGVADLEFLKRLQLQDKVRHVNVTDEELNYLYQKALLFVYPSLHEGFGLPMLEAFKANCPMVLSDTECFREIAEDAAVYFSPYSQEHLVEVLDNAMNNASLRAGLIAKGTKRLQAFPLHESVKQTLDVYRSLL